MKMLRKRKGMPRSRMGDIMEDLGGVGGMGSRAKTVRPKKKTLAKQKPAKKKVVAKKAPDSSKKGYFTKSDMKATKAPTKRKASGAGKAAAAGIAGVVGASSMLKNKKKKKKTNNRS